jgi:cell shape-determining protein MreC
MHFFSVFKDSLNYESEVDKLRAENDALRNELTQKNILLNGLSSYKKTFDFASYKNHTTVKSILSTVFANDNNFMKMYARSTSPLKKNDIIENDAGIIGRVVFYDDVTNIAEIQTARSGMFRVPVISTNTEVEINGIAVGNDTMLTKKDCDMYVKYIPESVVNKVKIGDVFVTSGEYGIVPRGILVGHTVKMVDSVACLKLSASISDKLIVFDYK